MESSSQLAVDIFIKSEQCALKNDFGVKDQIRRAAMSISNNIAEGFEYDNNKDFVRFLKYAKGSAGELRNQLFIINKANLIDEDFYKEKYNELIILSKQIASFIKYLINYRNAIV